MRILKNIFAIIALALCTGCTQNNGNIGFWFGTWRVTQVTIDGEPDENYANDLWFKFQTEVCDIIRVTDHNGNSEYWCKWSTSDDDKTLLLDYTFSGHAGYNPPACLPFQSDAINTLTVTKHSSRSISLSYQTPSGSTYVYSLKKE